MLPKRWHVHIVDLDPRIKSKPGKQRPCLVIQPSAFAEAGLESVVILPITSDLTRGDSFPLRVRLATGVCGLKRDSDIMVDQVLAWDLSLFREDLGAIPTDSQHAVSDALRDFLDL